MLHTVPKRIVILAVAMSAFVIFIVIQLIVISSGETGGAESGRGGGARGNIFDRNQRVLAMETRLDSIAAWIPDIDEPEQSVTILSTVLRMSASELSERLSEKEGYVLIKRYATKEESRQVAEYRREGKLRGILLQPIAGRIYPQRAYASTIIGYSGIDNIGLDGAEYSFDAFLTPDSTRQTHRGHDIFLTIDIVLQSFVDAIAKEALTSENADSVVAIVMDAKTGQILASSSVPDYDPNQFSDYPAQQRRNRAIVSIYEPGSVFKIFSIAAILEHGEVSVNDYFDTESGYRGSFEQYEITDLNPYGTISTAEIIKFSSNIGAAIASETISNDVLYETLSEFGFGRVTGIALNGEENAIFRQVHDWTERTKPTVAIGQEIGVTAMQMVAAATAIAGDGRVLRPEIVQRIVAADGETVYQSTPHYMGTPIRAETAHTMRTIMQTATEDGGTARRIRIDGVNISAKTGTAEVFDPAIGGYSEEHFISSAIAIMPTENPQYIAYLAIDYPKGENIYGGRIATPRLKSILEYIISYRGLRTERTSVAVPNQIYTNEAQN